MRNNIRAELSKSALIKRQKRNKRLIVYGSLLAAILLALVVTYFVQSANNNLSKVLTLEEAQEIVDAQLSDAYVSSRVDYLIVNNGTEADLIEKVAELSRKIIK